jgi:hypothetical protein
LTDFLEDGAGDLLVFIGMLLDQLRHEVRHLPYDSQQLDRLFRIDIAYFDKCMKCGVVDLDACAGFWGNAHLEVNSDVSDCTESADNLSMLQAEFKPQPTRRLCVHCQDRLMRHKRIVNGPEILLIPLYSDLEDEDIRNRRTIPLTTELSLDSISA